MSGGSNVNNLNSVSSVNSVSIVYSVQDVYSTVLPPSLMVFFLFHCVTIFIKKICDMFSCNTIRIPSH